MGILFISLVLLFSESYGHGAFIGSSGRPSTNIISSPLTPIFPRQKLYHIRGGSFSQNSHVSPPPLPQSSISSSLSAIAAGTVPSSTPSYTDSKGFDFGSATHDSLLSHLNITSDSVQQGLSSSEATDRQSSYGLNLLESPPGKSLLQLIASQFQDRLVQILLFVAFFSAIFSYYEHLDVETTNSWVQSFIEPIIILTILVLNAAVGVWQEKSAEGSLDALKKMQPSLAVVKRDGMWLDGVDAKDLVPGDIIRLRVGDKVSLFYTKCNLGEEFLIFFML